MNIDTEFGRVVVGTSDDDVYEGEVPHASTISHTSLSDDATFVGIIISSVNVEVYDDEHICGDWGYYPADFNLECYVDLKDLSWFALRWFETVE